MEGAGGDGVCGRHTVDGVVSFYPGVENNVDNSLTWGDDEEHQFWDASNWGELADLMDKWRFAV